MHRRRFFRRRFWQEYRRANFDTTGDATGFRFIDCKLNASVTKSTIPATHGAPRSISSGPVHPASAIRFASSHIRHARRGNHHRAHRRCNRWHHADQLERRHHRELQLFRCRSSARRLPFGTTPPARPGPRRSKCIWGGGAVPNDDEIWLDLEYLGYAVLATGIVRQRRQGRPAGNRRQRRPSSSATWGGSTTKFKLNVTFTAQQKGWVYARVKCAKASSTFYIDPLVTLT